MITANQITDHQYSAEIAAEAAALFGGLWQSLRRLERGRQEPLRMIGVSSCTIGAGVSTVAAGLAWIAAEQSAAAAPAETGPNGVLLVDANIQRPGLARRFSMPEDRRPGLADFVLSRSDLPECLHPAGREGLSLMPAGTAEARKALSGRIGNFEAAWRELRDSHPLVIVDFPTVEEPSLVLECGGLVDGILLVLEEGKAPRARLTRSNLLLHRAGVDVLGVVLNKPNTRLIRK